ncbi:MAG TPA: hypothetical protein VI007_05190 [bacterium]
MSEAPSRTNRWIPAAFLAVVIIGGSNFVAVRFSNRELPPFWGASIRFFASAPSMHSRTGGSGTSPPASLRWWPP